MLVALLNPDVPLLPGGLLQRRQRAVLPYKTLAPKQPVFYDGLQIALGFSQRYGTQLGQDKEGNPIILPLQNRAELEKYRKEIGLPPMAEYLKLAEQYLYPGKTIRFADDL